MCGIAGRISWVHPPDAEQIRKMTARLWHRGPDAEGVFVEGPAGLGHRRLAVIDVSPKANQPMLDHGGRFVISFNGEIYNYRELRAELEGLGARMLTDSDTEVLLEAYKAWGPACVHRLNGMFAFAVWDRAEQRLCLARDRLGKKPLFYLPLPCGGLIFASELKALRVAAETPTGLNPRALAQFLSLNYVLSPECMVEGVRKLDPAHYVLVERDGPLQPVPYWDLASRFKTKRRFRHEREAVEALSALLDDAVRVRLVSDVPLGAFLSGGLDSSAIVASMARFREARHIKTFSVGFEEPSYSELSWARTAAGHLRVDHHEDMVTPDLAKEIGDMAAYADEPLGDTSFIPTFLLARFARRHVTVCLSGDGGDELFAGYETYTADTIHRAVRHVPAPLLGAAHALAERWLPVTRRKVGLDYKIRQFLKGASLAPMEAHYSWRTIFSRQDARHVLSPELATAVAAADPFQDFARWQRDVSECHYLDQAMYVDIKTWLANDILVKADRATMAHSLEARMPFLDYRLVEFAASLPPHWKMKRLRRKHLLKESQRGRLPRGILNRSKQGFNAPVSHWIATSLREPLAETLRSENTKQVLNRPYVEGLQAQHERGLADNSLKLFGILCLGLWLRQT